MNLDEIDYNVSHDKAQEIASKLETKERKDEFWNKWDKAYTERTKPDEINESEIKNDTWRCERCQTKFEWERGKVPLECDSNQGGCGKSSNKTNFEALTGPYQYFDLTGSKKEFIPKWLGDDIKGDYHFITLSDNENIYVFDGGIYKPDAESLIKEEANERLGALYDPYHVNKTIEYLQTSTYVDRKDLNSDKHLIALENGIYDIKEGKLKEHSPEYLITQKIPVKYDKNAECPKIMSFLDDILHDEDIPIIQEIAGYCLLKDYPFAKAFMLLGSGANGKSTFLNLLKTFIGSDNVANPSLQDLLYNRFARADLYGKLANIHADLSARKLDNTGIFKMLTGKDTLRAERKFKDAFNFENYAKLLYSANELPRSTDVTDAFFRRWVIIEFPNQFNEHDEKTDPNILEKITTDEELSGFLNFALEGLERLLRQGHFSHSKTRDEIKDEWILRSDSLRAFTERKIDVDTNSFITKDNFYNEYTSFCDEHDASALDKSVVGRKLPTLLPKVQSYKPQVDGKQKRAWKGIKFKKDSNNTVSGVDYSDIKGDSEDKAQSSLTIDRNDKTDDTTLRKHICETIEGYNANHSNQGTPMSFIIDIVEDETDYDRTDIEHQLRLMRENGEIYTPLPDKFKLG